MATVTLTAEVERDLERLPVTILARIEGLFRRLANWPQVSGARPLSGELAGHWRIRTGDYRVMFRLEGDTVVVEKVGHRDRFYED